MGVAIYSYDGALGFGVTGDADGPLDVLVLCRGIEAAMEELLATARAARTTRPQAPRGGSARAPSRARSPTGRAAAARR